MTSFTYHICGLALFGLFASPASSQELTADRSGMGDLRFFAEHCLDEAPSFEGTIRTIRIRAGMQRRILGQVPELDVFAEGDKCICAASFIDWHTHVPNVVQNLHYVVKDEVPLAWRSAKKDPTEIELDFDGTQAFVRISQRDTSQDGIKIVSAMIERDGSCPA